MADETKYKQMKNYKILIVDDSISNLKTMVSIFKNHESHYHTLQTNKPKEALVIARQTQPDLIISDWDMPHLSGLELIRQIKSKDSTKDIPVIMATGVMVNTDHLKIALEAGAIDYVRKPIEPVELIARTKAALLITKYYKELIDQRNQELTESTLQLVRNQKNISTFSGKLEKLAPLIEENPQKAKTEISQLGKELERESRQESWTKFHLSFSKVHSNFSSNLLEKFPKLTPTDIKICSFIRLGMSNKEMASVMNQSPDSVKVSRYRLRKKMELHRSVNFENFLSRF